MSFESDEHCSPAGDEWRVSARGVTRLASIPAAPPALSVPHPETSLLPAATVLVLEDTGTVLGHGVAPARLQPPGNWLGAGQHGHQRWAQHLLERFTPGNPAVLQAASGTGIAGLLCTGKAPVLRHGIPTYFPTSKAHREQLRGRKYSWVLR